MSIHVEIIPNHGRKPSILLRRAWREGRRIRKEQLAVSRSLPHGHVCAALAVCRRLGLPKILGRRRHRRRDLALAAVIARVIDPASKLATARALSPDTAATSLGAALGLGEVTGNEMLAMLDWLLERQRWIERSLANRHLRGGTLILYDVSSSYVEGRKCPLAAFGHSRDGKRGKKQITYGLLCAADGCPVAVEVFAGNAADPSTVASQAAKVRERFGIGRVALVGDRGMLTAARIREDVGPAGLDWISALKSADIRKLAREGPGGQWHSDRLAVPGAVFCGLQGVDITGHRRGNIFFTAPLDMRLAICMLWSCRFGNHPWTSESSTSSRPLFRAAA